VATPPVGRHGIVSVNEEKPRKLPQLECHPLSSMRVKIELLTDFTKLIIPSTLQSCTYGTREVTGSRISTSFLLLLYAASSIGR